MLKRKLVDFDALIGETIATVEGDEYTDSVFFKTTSNKLFELDTDGRAPIYLLWEEAKEE